MSDQSTPPSTPRTLDVTLDSFIGTLAFARQVLWAIFIACLVSLIQSGSGFARLAVAAAITAIAAAYLSQAYTTHGEHEAAVRWQIGSALAAVAAVLLFLVGG